MQKSYSCIFTDTLLLSRIWKRSRIPVGSLDLGLFRFLGTVLWNHLPNLELNLQHHVSDLLLIAQIFVQS